MADVREHLAGCPHCSAELAALQRLLALAALDTVPAMPVSENEFLRGVRRRTRAQGTNGEPQTTSYRLRLVRLVPLLAAAGVLVAVGVFIVAHRARVRTESDYAAVLAEPDSPDLLDLAGSESELIRDLDTSSLAAIEFELTDNAEVDELVEELTPRQQGQLVMELTRLYGGSKAQLTGG